MGKEWLYWGSSKSAKRGRFSTREEEIETPPAGCMCAVLQLFDLNHFQFSLPQQQYPSFKPDAFLQEEHTVLKGVEAPRNSLEQLQPSMRDASLSSTKKQFADLNIPVGIQIKTRMDTKSPRESTSECTSSPGAKTPSLVARLMGLDLLPEAESPSLSSTRNSTSNSSLLKPRLHHQSPNRHEDRAKHLLDMKSSCSGTRSLPETPRVSSGRRSDVEQRLSLQINKENTGEEFDISAYIAKKMARIKEAKQEHENRRSGHSGNQIVKESASRRVGVDITNTIKNREQIKDENDHVVLLKAKKISRVDEFSSSKQSTHYCSQRLRSLDLQNKKHAYHSPKFSSSSVSPADNYLSSQDKNSFKPKSNVQHVQLLQKQSNQREKSIQKCEKVTSERYSSRLKKPPQASPDGIRSMRKDPFVRSPSKNRVNNLTDKMCKKIPLSNELLHSNVPTLLTVKKQNPFAPGIKSIDQKQSVAYDDAPRLKMSQSFNQEAMRKFTIQENIQDDKCNVRATTSGNEEEYYHQYIQRILKRSGIDKSTPVSLAKWYSPTHPLDPSIFHHIELLNHTYFTIFIAKGSNLHHRCNRKLIFQLVDELLAQILKPYINFKPWVSTQFAEQCDMINGSQLIDTLCSRIKAFPSANCQVLEDIDSLIDIDLCESQLRRSSGFEEEEEREMIAREIEGEIMECLVHEICDYVKKFRTGEQNLSKVTWGSFT